MSSPAIPKRKAPKLSASQGAAKALPSQPKRAAPKLKAKPVAAAAAASGEAQYAIPSQPKRAAPKLKPKETKEVKQAKGANKEEQQQVAKQKAREEAIARGVAKAEAEASKQAQEREADEIAKAAAAAAEAEAERLRAAEALLEALQQEALRELAEAKQAEEEAAAKAAEEEAQQEKVKQREAAAAKGGAAASKPNIPQRRPDAKAAKATTQRRPAHAQGLGGGKGGESVFMRATQLPFAASPPGSPRGKGGRAAANEASSKPSISSRRPAPQLVKRLKSGSRREREDSGNTVEAPSVVTEDIRLGIQRQNRLQFGSTPTPKKVAGFFTALLEFQPHEQVEAMERMVLLPALRDGLQSPIIQSLLALEQGKWQACIFPLFAAFSSTEEPTEAEQRLFALVMNVVALIHFSYLMKGGDGKRGAAFKYMKTSLQRLKIFFKEWNKQTLDLASLMLSSLLHLVEKRAVAKKMLDNFLNLAWRNVLDAMDLIETFLFMYPEIKEESAATNGGKAGVNSKLKAGKRTSRYGVHCTDCRCSDAALTLKAHELCQTMLAIIQRSKKLDPDLTCVDANSNSKYVAPQFRGLSDDKLASKALQRRSEAEQQLTQHLRFFDTALLCFEALEHPLDRSIPARRRFNDMAELVRAHKHMKVKFDRFQRAIHCQHSQNQELWLSMDYYEEDEEEPEAPTSLTSLLSDNDNTPKKGGKEKDGSLSRKEDEEEDEEEDEKEEEDDVIEQPAVESEADKKQRLQRKQSRELLQNKARSSKSLSKLIHLSSALAVVTEAQDEQNGEAQIDPRLRLDQSRKPSRRKSQWMSRPAFAFIRDNFEQLHSGASGKAATGAASGAKLSTKVTVATDASFLTDEW